MKTIPNVKTSIQGQPTYSTILLECLNRVPADGYTLQLMRARNRVADVLEKAADAPEIQLEDADYQAAVEAVKAMRWAIRHEDIVKFCDAFGV